MRTQLQPVSEKVHASFGDEHAPLHSGASASPHEVLRHSHDAVPTAAPQVPPPGQLPRHSPLVNRQPAATVVVVTPPGTVVVVLTAPGVPDAGTQKSCAVRNVISRLPKASVNVAAPGAGLRHFAG